MEITSAQINEIAQELQTGTNIYINRDTLEIRAIIDFDSAYGDTEYWEDELEKIQTEWTDYIIIEKMSSHEAFEVMEDFIDHVDDPVLKSSLSTYLERKSPFANFKAEIDESEYRQKWFDFRQAKYEDYVKKQLEAEEIDYE